MSWPAKVLDGSLPAGRADAILTLTSDEVVATIEGELPFSIPLAKLELSWLGFDRDLLELRAAGTEQPRFTSRDPGVVAALRKHGHPGVVAALAALKARRRDELVRKWILPLAACALLAGGALWFVLVPLPRLAAAALPPSVDLEIGRAALPSVLAELGGEAKTLKQPEVVLPVQGLLDRVTRELPAGSPVFRLTVIDNEMVNAFALPGGFVVVTTGLLRSAGSPDAVCGVLAHEVAHVLERHSVQSLVQRVGLLALVSIVFGDASAVVNLVMRQAADLASLGFSRDMESDADRVGVALLRQAKLPATGLRAFLETLKAREGDEGSWMRIVSTHPLTTDRISELDALLAGAPVDHEPLELDWEALQLQLRGGAGVKAGEAQAAGE